MVRPHIDFSELKDYQAVKSNGPLTLKSYLEMFATVDLGVALCEHLWPEFIKFDNCYFRKSQFDEQNYFHWKEHLKDDKGRIETVINHLHIYDLFADSPRVSMDLYSNKVWFYMASVMQQTWQAALKMQYPEHNFEVEVFTEEDLVDPQVTFHLVR